jgi:hypothetical protein
VCGLEAASQTPYAGSIRLLLQRQTQEPLRLNITVRDGTVINPNSNVQVDLEGWRLRALGVTGEVEMTDTANTATATHAAAVRSTTTLSSWPGKLMPQKGTCGTAPDCRDTAAGPPWK